MAATKSTTLWSLVTLRAYLGLSAAAALSVVSLTSVGTTVTATVTAHGLATGDTVTIAGATPVVYNGTFAVTVLTANTFTYVMGAAGTSPATGTITVSGPDTREDVLICQIGNRVSQQLEKATGRLFVLRTGLTETWNGNDRPVRMFRYMDIVGLTSLTVDGGALDASAYFLEGRVGQVTLKDGAGFTGGIGNCVAAFSAVGWGTQDAMPDDVSDIVEAGLEQVKAVYDEKVSGAVAASSITIGPSSFVVKPGMNYNVKDIIALWKDARG